MMILNEIAEKINKILNGTDTEVTIQRPTDLEFYVFTTGFHIDRIADATTNKNFIPVFISSMGGQINAVPDLKQIDATIPLVFYFPVRFKNVFFALNDYLADAFVGKTLTYGTYSGKAISNISFARYGEIQDIDLDQFKEWIGEVAQQELEVSEPFMTMEISLYLSSADPQFVFGNNVKITSISIDYKGTTILTDTSPICIDRAKLGSSEPATQQLFGDTHSKGFAANAGYSDQIPLILKNTTEYNKLLEICEVTKDIQNLKITITETIPIKNANQEDLVVTHTHFVTNYSRRTSLGQLLGISLTLADRKDD